MGAGNSETSPSGGGAGGQEVGRGAGGVSMCVMWEAREGVVWERGGGSGMARAKERHQS